MTDRVVPVEQALLDLCAILQWFDQDLLVIVGRAAPADVAIILSSDLVVPDEERPGMFRLRPAAQLARLEQLRATGAGDELTLHGLAFAYFIERLTATSLNEQRAHEEAACFHHLDRLFALLLPRMEWQRISASVAAARATQPQQARHLRRLELYDGYVASRTKDYARAERILTTLLQEPDLEDEARSHALNALANVYHSQTEHDRALAVFQQLYDHACAIDSPTYQGVGLINMAMIQLGLENHQQALVLGLRCLELFREKGERAREAYALYVIANSAMFLGRWEFAEEHYQQAEALFSSLGITAPIYWGWGYLRLLQGDTAGSEERFRRSLARAQSAPGGEPIETMDCLMGLGLLYETEERWTEALDSYAEAIALARQMGHQHRLSLLHYRKGRVLAHQGQLDDAYASYQVGIEVIEALRGVTQQESTRISLFGTARQIYEAMVLLCLQLGRREEAFHYGERARSRAFLDSLATKAPELYEELNQPVATLAEVQARLPQGALLLEYFTTGVVPRGEHLLNKLPPESAHLRDHLALPPRTLLFAVSRERVEVHQVALDPNSLRPPEHDPGPGRRLLRGRLPTVLHERLIAPVEHLLRGLGSRGQLYLVPHGPLHYVPFMALRSATGEYLLDAGGPAVALAPSATILLRNCLGRPPRPVEGALALGYNGDGEMTLRYAEAEARHVARVLGGEAWTGPEPKGRRLLAAARAGRQVRWLHFAGHAVYDPHEPLNSALRLGADDMLSARAILDGLDIQAELVTLSACTSGLSHVVPGDELLGLQRALLYAGAPAVVCTLWEAHDLVTLLVMERFYTDLLDGKPAAVALRDAQVAVREMTAREVDEAIERWPAEDVQFAGVRGDFDGVPVAAVDDRPFADPFYWAPFMVIGRP